MRSKVNLVYKLNGTGVEDGIDVFELSPVLLSFGELITSAHRTIYPDKKDISVNIEPFKKGSFEIPISLFAKDALESAMDLLNNTQVEDIKDLLIWIGFIIGTERVSLIRLIEFLKGKAEKIEKMKSGLVKYISKDGLSITVDNQVHNLYQNCHIQQTIYNCTGRPLEYNGIESIESYIKEDGENTKVTYDKKIVEPIKKYSEPLELTNEDDMISENKRILIVHPKKGDYEGDPKAWSFRVAGTREIIKANITDTSFLANVKSGKYRLANTDLLKVRVVERQKIKGNRIMKSNEINSVLDYKVGGEQLSLDYLKNNESN